MLFLSPVIFFTFLFVNRKILRAIRFVGEAFPQIYAVNITRAMEMIGEAYSMFGDLNDLITGAAPLPFVLVFSACHFYFVFRICVLQ